MKLSKCGICSMSEGTGVVPSRKGSRLKCVLSKMIVTTWLTFPRGELSRQPPAAFAAADAASLTPAPPDGRAAARLGVAHAGVSGEKAMSTAVPAARALRCQLAQTLASELFWFSHTR